MRNPREHSTNPPHPDWSRRQIQARGLASKLLLGSSITLAVAALVFCLLHKGREGTAAVAVIVMVFALVYFSLEASKLAILAGDRGEALSLARHLRRVRWSRPKHRLAPLGAPLILVGLTAALLSRQEYDALWMIAPLAIIAAVGHGFDRALRRRCDKLPR